MLGLKKVSLVLDGLEDVLMGVVWPLIVSQLEFKQA